MTKKFYKKLKKATEEFAKNYQKQVLENPELGKNLNQTEIDKVCKELKC